MRFRQKIKIFDSISTAALLTSLCQLPTLRSMSGVRQATVCWNVIIASIIYQYQILQWRSTNARKKSKCWNTLPSVELLSVNKQRTVTFLLVHRLTQILDRYEFKMPWDTLKYFNSLSQHLFCFLCFSLFTKKAKKQKNADSFYYFLIDIKDSLNARISENRAS